MPKFNVEHNSSQPKNETFEKLQNYLSKKDELQKLDANIQCTIDKENCKAHLKGSQFKAEINVNEHSNGSKLIVQVDIPFLLMPFKGKIEETLLRKLAKYVG